MLPTTESSTLGRPEPERVWRTMGEGETVLVVEDDVAVRTFAARALMEYGYRVIAAGTAEEALRLARATQPCPALAICDVVLPDLSGLALASQLREALPGLRVLLLSGYSADVLSRQGLDPTTHELVSKPFTADALARRVHERLHPKRSSASDD